MHLARMTDIIPCFGQEVRSIIWHEGKNTRAPYKSTSFLVCLIVSILHNWKEKAQQQTTNTSIKNSHKPKLPFMTFPLHPMASEVTDKYGGLVSWPPGTNWRCLHDSPTGPLRKSRMFYKICLYITYIVLRKPMTMLLWHVWKQLHPWLSKRRHLSWRDILFVTPCYHAGLPQVDILYTLNMMPEWSSCLWQPSAVISLLWIECSSVDQTIAQVLDIIITVKYLHNCPATSYLFDVATLNT